MVLCLLELYVHPRCTFCIFVVTKNDPLRSDSEKSKLCFTWRVMYGQLWSCLYTRICLCVWYLGHFAKLLLWCRGHPSQVVEDWRGREAWHPGSPVHLEVWRLFYVNMTCLTFLTFSMSCLHKTCDIHFLCGTMLKEIVSFSFFCG